jgi:hypothetical protein
LFEQATCAYCCMTELQTASPFVVGQSRAEFDAYMDLYGGTPSVDGVIGKNKDTAVEFVILKTEVPTPRIEMPSFPELGSADAQRFLSAVGKKKGATSVASAPGDEPCPIVHELCALNMFRNRVARYRFASLRL